MTATSVDIDRTRAVADEFIRFLETNQAPDGLFAPDVFGDLSLPLWRLQADNAADLVAIRTGGHPDTGRVVPLRFDPTPTGFVLEFEETWRSGGRDWYCREMIRADLSDAGISELSVYCTGDWDEMQVARHRAEVTLIRP